MSEIDTTNKWMVGCRAKNVIVFKPPREMSADEALVFAAWVVAMARPFTTTKFEDVLESVEAT